MCSGVVLPLPNTRRQDISQFLMLVKWTCQTKKKYVVRGNGILLLKLFWPTVRKKCSIDREKLLKFEAEGRELQKIWDH